MRATIAMSLTLAVLAGGTAPAQRIESPLGSQIRLDVRGADPVSGELLAAQGDSLWLLLSRGAMQGVGLADVTRARVPRGGLTSGRILTWTLLGGLASGALLTAACSSVDDADCGAVLPAVLLSWGVVGGITAALAGSDWRAITAEVTVLAPYSRFPQGLPVHFMPPAGP